MTCTDNRDSVLSFDRVLRRLRSRPCVLRSGSSALRPAASASSSVQRSGSSVPRPESFVQCPAVLVLSCACVRPGSRSPDFCAQVPVLCAQNQVSSLQMCSRSAASAFTFVRVYLRSALKIRRSAVRILRSVFSCSRVDPRAAL
eukprot:gene17024-biopygen5089